jgi:hypothetical protein
VQRCPFLTRKRLDAIAHGRAIVNPLNRAYVSGPAARTPCTAPTLRSDNLRRDKLCIMVDTNHRLVVV